MGRAVRTLLRAAPGGLCLGLLCLAVPAGAAPGFANRAPMPFPVAWAAPTDPTLSYADLACPTASTCTAIGAYLDTHGAFLPTADTEVDGSWQAPTSVALPKGATSYADGLRSLSCPTAEDCVAVGTAQSASPLIEPIVATETAGVWSDASTKVPVPKGTQLGYLWSVWCGSVGSCVAAGSYATSVEGDVHAFVDVETAGVWGASEALADPVSPEVTSDLQVFPQGLSCSGPGNCVVVGYLDGSPATTAELAFATVETDGVWGTPTVFNPGSSDQAFLRAVSCAPQGPCMAVGSSFPSTALGPLPYAVVYISGKWREPRYLVHKVGTSYRTTAGQLDSVSCPNASTCVAVGSLALGSLSKSTNPDDGLMGVGYTWADGVWSKPSVIVPRVEGDAVIGGTTFDAVSCRSATLCQATGTFIPFSTNANEETPFWLHLAPVAPVTKPSSPRHFSVRPVRNRFLARWAAPVRDGGTAITRYRVTADGDGVRQSSCTTTTTSCTLDGIHAGVRYVLDVTATNAGGHTGAASRIFATGWRPPRRG